MTYKEDVIRATNPDTVDFLYARIKALELRVEFLEAKIEVNTNN